jgi:heme-degrading monooxygenase HmoA
MSRVLDDGHRLPDAAVLEHAVLDVMPGREEEFELAFAEARRHIASADGFEWLRLLRCAEQPHRYLLMVGWASLEDHTEGFRGSPAYEEWRRLLHHFYDPFPTVEHFTVVTSA